MDFQHNELLESAWILVLLAAQMSNKLHTWRFAIPCNAIVAVLESTPRSETVAVILDEFSFAASKLITMDEEFACSTSALTDGPQDDVKYTRISFTMGRKFDPWTNIRVLVCDTSCVEEDNIGTFTSGDWSCATMTSSELMVPPVVTRCTAALKLAPTIALVSARSTTINVS